MPKQHGLSQQQLAFIDEYMVTNNSRQAYLKAYDPDGTKNLKVNGVDASASALLRRPKVAEEIRKRQEEQKKASIATAQEVMEYFTKVMNGEILDQFGLEAPLSERTKAAQELAKRTVDLENRLAGKADAEVKITLDWSRD